MVNPPLCGSVKLSVPVKVLVEMGSQIFRSVEASMTTDWLVGPVRLNPNPEPLGLKPKAESEVSTVSG